MPSKHYTLPQSNDLSSATTFLWQQENISAATIFVPTANAAKAVTDAFNATSSEGTSALPNILPLSPSAAGFSLAPEAPLIEPLQKRLFFFQQLTARAKAQKLPLPASQAWALAATLEDIVSEFILHELDAAAVKDILAQHHLARHWEDNLALLNIALTTYPAYLAENNLTDSVQHDKKIYAAWAEFLTQKSAPLYATGFPDTTPLGMKILRAIAHHPQGCIISPALTGDALADVPLANLWHALDVPAPQKLPETTPSSSTLSTLTAPSTNTAALAIALLMKEQFLAEKSAMIVTPNAHFGRAVQQHLGAWGLTADDSAGLALAATAEGQFLQCLLSAAAELSPTHLAALLHHPLCALSDTNALDHLLLRGQPPQNLRLNAYAYKLKQAAFTFPKPRAEDITAANTCWEKLENALQPLLDIPVHTQGLPTYLEHVFSAFVQLTGAEISEEISMTLTDWASALEGASLPLNRSIVNDLILAHLGSVITRPRGLNNLKIRGPLQARFDTADTIILAPLDVGEWPAETPTHPWLNNALRQELNLPDMRKTQNLAMNHFWSLLRRHNADIFLVRTTQNSAGDINTASPLWDAALAEYDASTRATMAARAEKYLAYAEAYLASEQRTGADFYTPDNTLTDAPTSTPETWSASFVDALMNCPYRGRMERFHRLAPLQDYDAEPDARDKGNLVHDVLFAFYEAPKHAPRDCPPPFGEPISYQNLSAATAHLHQILVAYLGDLPAHISAPWQMRLQPQLAAWAGHMAALYAQGRIPNALEISGEIALLPSLILKAKADRIDVDYDGQSVIIDYKTGSLPSKKDVENGVKPQLLVEAWLASESAFGDILNAPAHIEHWEIGTNTNDFKTNVIPLTEEMMTNADNGLKALAAHHHTSNAYPATPAGTGQKPEGHCQFCDFSGVCRYKNQRPEAPKAEAS